VLFDDRCREERTLLNPGFCANLIWHAATGGRAALSFEESFLVLPMVLHRATREALPRSTRTSLAVWLEENPLSRSRIAKRARALGPFTKEALMLGGVHGLYGFQSGKLVPSPSWRRKVNRALGESAEVSECAKKAMFVGKWFAEVGSAATVMALIGVRP